MNERTRALLVLTAYLLSPFFTEGVKADCHTFRCAPVVVRKAVPVVKKQVVEVVRKDVVNFVQVPLYSVAYDAHAYQSAYTAKNYQNRVAYERETVEERLVKLLEVQERRLAILEQQYGKNGGALSGNVRANGAAFVKHCAGCHDSSNADSKGAGIVFFQDREPLNWNCATREKILKVLMKGTMPKGGPEISQWPEAEQNDAMAFLDYLESAEAQSEGNGAKTNGTGR